MNLLIKNFTNLKIPVRTMCYKVDKKDRYLKKTFNRKQNKGYQARVGFKHRVNAIKRDDPTYNIEKEDIDTEDLEYLDDAVTNLRQTYDRLEWEKSNRHEKMLLRIMKRKYFKEEPEPCFLTWAAKEQIRFLRESDPELWTFEKLAESFPVTVEGVKKFLKTKRRNHKLEDTSIINHDKKVLNNWKLLQDGKGGPIASALSLRLQSGSLSYDAINVNTKLPLPSNSWQQKYLSPPAATPPKSPGEFESMITSYKDMKLGIKKDLIEPKMLLSDKVIDDKREEEINQIEIMKSSRRNLETTFEEFKAKLKTKLSKSVKQEEISELKSWMKKLEPRNTNIVNDYIDYGKKPDIEDYFMGKIEKYQKKDLPEIKWDTPSSAESGNEKEAYIYDRKLGYQRPYGRHEGANKINIPQDQYKEGAVYQKGNSFYDAEGNLLYKIPKLTETKS